MSETYGALAAALAKAQAAFPVIGRDKEVTVQTKAGGSYKFKYAPLDTILAAVRKPLSDNGLAIVQLLDEDVLVTSLMHESGAILSGRTPIPASEGIQAYGSAITYLRRYAIQALLGIAAEEDDDGNRAAGNAATFSGKRQARLAPANEGEPVPQRLAPANDDGGLVGTVRPGKGDADFELRQTEDGYRLGFRLESPAGGIKVTAASPLAEELKTYEAQILGQRVTCWGRIVDRTFTPKGTTKEVTYQELSLERIRVPELGDLPIPVPETVPLFPADIEAELDAAVPA